MLNLPFFSIAKLDPFLFYSLIMDEDSIPERFELEAADSYKFCNLGLPGAPTPLRENVTKMLQQVNVPQVS